MTAVMRVDALCDQLLAELPPATADPVAFLGRQYDLGLAWVHFPEGRGGLGLDPALQGTIAERLQSREAPDPWAVNFLGYGMGGATLVTHGTADQQQRFLRPLFTGEQVWCQLFSEPGAGSDLAGLATRAERDGAEWVVNGQKVWTTFGHLARWGMLLARTDPDAPKHRGITFFVVDMHAPGVEVRPLIQMTGEAEFNEVYLTDVRIPDEARIGEVGGGWGVALTTLANERVSIGGQVPPRGGGPIAGALDLWRSGGHRDEVKADALIALWVEAEALRLTNIRALQKRAVGVPGPEGSIGKIVSADLNKRVTAFALSLLGAEGQLKPGGYPMGRPDPTLPSTHQHDYLRARGNSIEGGTSEISKNILAERVLGLPGDIRVDKGIPWRDVPRS